MCRGSRVCRNNHLYQMLGVCLDPKHGWDTNMQGEPHHTFTFLKQAEVRGMSCRIIHERKHLGSKLTRVVDFVIALDV